MIGGESPLLAGINGTGVLILGRQRVARGFFAAWALAEGSRGVQPLWRSALRKSAVRHGMEGLPLSSFSVTRLGETAPDMLNLTPRKRPAPCKIRSSTVN